MKTLQRSGKSWRRCVAALAIRPRMTRAIAAGTGEIEGVRFNRGGWWNLKIAITAERGADTVAFDLGL